MRTGMLGRSAGVATVLAMLIAGCGGPGDDVAIVDVTAPASSRSPSAGPSASADPATSGSPSSPAGPRTVEAAIQRYEYYLHALGRGDVPALCEVAGPAAKQAEQEGWGQCEQLFPLTLRMFSSAERNALRDATVDPALVAARTPSRVEVPARAVRASTTFTSSNLGDSVMEYIDGAWYVVD